MNQFLDPEFDRQVTNLVSLGYANLLGESQSEFTSRASLLKHHLANLPDEKIDPLSGRLSFVLVPKLVSTTAEEAMGNLTRLGKSGVAKLFPLKSTDFSPIPSVTIPDSNLYLLVGVDRGSKYLNIKPQEALVDIQSSNRSPLTIDEGAAILIHFPDFLAKNNCFSLLASRASDQRVPAIWISEGRPKLGWCWDGNPHTWLGSASCAQRLA